MPTSITFDASTFGAEVIKIYEIDITKAATYTVSVVAIDRKTFIKSAAVLFDAVIRLRASALTLIPSTEINNLTYLISDPIIVFNLP